MGYRSSVRSLIYGDPDKIDALVAKHTLLGTEAADSVLREVRRYSILRDTAAPGVVVMGSTYEVLDLYGDSWKWYDSYPDVQFWHALLEEAAELGLNTEFVRIGENENDIQIERNIQDDGCELVNVYASIECDIGPGEGEGQNDG